MVNWIATLLVTPRALPRMDFSTGIPPTSRALVIVPTLLTSDRGDIDDLVEALEVRFLANRDDNLRFGLLTDFADAPAETMPEDAALLRHAQKRIDALNGNYGGDSFYLFHRPRRWNDSERVWMGYERKRGKLADLNWLLRKSARVVVRTVLADRRRRCRTGGHPLRDHARYRHGIAARCSATVRRHDGAPAEPPAVRCNAARVRRGYGILQPRVSPSLPGTNRSRYARLHSGDSGIDPYTRTVSDVYQDLFDEGSFIGKGIYDVDAFEQSIDDKFPENRILSHDLLEGCYARSGLLSDVELFEDYPPTYAPTPRAGIAGSVATGRSQAGCCPACRASRDSAPQSADGAVELENRRQPAAQPRAGHAFVVIAGRLARAASPDGLDHRRARHRAAAATAQLPLQLVRKPREAPLRQHLAVTVQSTATQCAHAGLTLACLPHEAFFSADAILRTTWRILVSHRPAAGMEPFRRAVATARQAAGVRAVDVDCAGRRDCDGRVPGRCAAAGAAACRAAPAALADLTRHYLVGESSTAPTRAGAEPRRTVFLRRLARRTWAFFETFVGPRGQLAATGQHPGATGPRVAHRTSPTNIGLALLANWRRTTSATCRPDGCSSALPSVSQHGIA